MQEERVYTIRLADGTELTNLRMNGSNYISSLAVTEDAFVDNCDPVVISDGENEETHDHMALIHITKYGDDYYFALRDRTKEELDQLKIKADIEYLAMMSDIEL